MEIQWRCLKCLKVNGGPAAPPGGGPFVCAGCSETSSPAPRALDAEGRLRGCPACGCPDIYRQRDFNPKLGAGIVLIGMALAPFTHYLSIVGCLLIDAGIYAFIPDAAVCYNCRAVMRGYPDLSSTPPFDLNISDKYIETERRRGW